MSRQSILKKIYEYRPFSLKADLNQVLPIKENFISCLICSAKEAQLLENILCDLKNQTLKKDYFEIVVLDNSLKGLGAIVEKHSQGLTLQYLRDDSKEGFLGHLRNQLLSQSQGEYILFLDDDTRLPHRDFLKTALDLFKDSHSDVLIPYGQGIPLKSNPSYKFLDPYSLATRCCLYRRSVLEKLGGFHNKLNAYEDIDLGIRLALAGVQVMKTDQLKYEHPPLFFDSMRKPLAIGSSVLKLRRFYPWYLWLLIYLNALRFLPRILIPTIRNRQWFKISLGVLLAPFTRRKFTY